MNTFIRAVEIWKPGLDGGKLACGGGLYGKATRFGDLSRDVVFGYGEGLPGTAWKSGNPVILRRFEGSYFQRTEVAHADGLTSGIALPIFAGDFLTSVLVIFCGDDSEHAGAIELWHNDPAESADMTLADGYYGTTGDTFETVSRHLSLRRGSGLPGLSWQRQGPVFMADLGRSAGFLRADSATRVGINRGFAIPCSGQRDDTWVMTFLSALGTPIVRRFEIWEPDAQHIRLLRNGGFCETVGVLDELPEGAALGLGEGCIGQVLLTGMPAVSAQVASEPLVGAVAKAVGLESLVAIPVIRGGRLQSVVAWYF